MKDTVYYLPGMGGRLNTGLGRGIYDRGFSALALNATIIIQYE
jgi:hypothetical protein